MPELEISRIHDAYASGGECPLCTVMSAADTGYVRSFRGARVMAPEVRVETNRSGFCPDHYERLYRGEGKLGLALMVHTHLAEALPALRSRMDGAVKAAARPPAGLAARLRRRSPAAASLASAIRELVGRCFICDMLAKDLDRYCFTVLYLWQRDDSYPDKLRSSRGFCLAHYAALLDKAAATLRPEELARWLRDTVPLMTGSMERIEGEILAFTQSYHHDARGGARTEEERTALTRALQKLAGRVMRLEHGLAPGPAEDQDQDRLS